MSEVKGMLKTCDRCGTQIFLKCTGEGVADGGFTRWNEFEQTPPGWNFISGVGAVCPKCWEEYVQMLEEYKNISPQKQEA